MSQPRVHGTAFETALTLALILVLAWAPFPYGSNRPWASSSLALVVGALLVLWAGGVVIGRARLTSLTQKLWLPAICAGGAIAWALFQTIDLAAVDRALGGHLFASWFAHPVWSMASAALGTDAGAYVSVDPERTWSAIVAACRACALFFLCFQLARDADRARLLLLSIIVVGCAYAAVGFAEAFLHLDVHSWLMADAKPADNRLSGPFVNPNHFATFAGMTGVAAIGSLVDAVRRSIVWDRGGRILMRTLLQAVAGANTVLLAGALLLLSTVLLTQSRGGIAAFLIGLVVLIVALQRREATRSGVPKWIAPAFLVLVVAGAVWIAAAPLLERAQQQGVEDASRLAIARSAITAIGSAPLLGNGFGAFERYYPLYSNGTVAGDVDEAHDDYLEALADLGLPAGVLLMAAPFILALICWRGARTRRRDRLFPAVGAATAALVGTHAVVDFSLQIPAVALLFTMLLGIGTAQAWSTAQSDD